jgi:phosphate transport system substrate-binding protein
MKNGPELVKEVKFFALPSQAYATNLEHLSKKKIGTVFGGKPEVDLKIEEVLKREASL